VGASGGSRPNASVLLANGSAMVWSSSLGLSGSASMIEGRWRQVLPCGSGDVGSGLSFTLADDGRVWYGLYSDRSVLLGADQASLLAPSRSNLGCDLLMVKRDGTLAEATTRSVTGNVGGLPALKQAECNVQADASAARYCVALSATGEVWAWGSNSSGQLGDGGITSRADPRAIVGVSGVTAVRTAPGQVFALTGDGRVFSWGLAEGLGRDTAATPAYIPGQVTGLPAVSELATGGHVVVLGADGSVWGWGRNQNGELNTGDRIDRPRPVQVLGIPGP
jgi:hypothetical protein